MWAARAVGASIGAGARAVGTAVSAVGSGQWAVGSGLSGHSCNCSYWSRGSCVGCQGSAHSHYIKGSCVGCKGCGHSHQSSAGLHNEAPPPPKRATGWEAWVPPQRPCQHCQCGSDTLLAEPGRPAMAAAFTSLPPAWWMPLTNSSSLSSVVASFSCTPPSQALQAAGPSPLTASSKRSSFALLCKPAELNLPPDFHMTLDSQGKAQEHPALQSQRLHMKVTLPHTRL